MGTAVDGYTQEEWRLRWEVPPQAADITEWADVEVVGPTREAVQDRVAGLLLQQEAGEVRDVRLVRCTLTYTPTDVDL